MEKDRSILELVSRLSDDLGDQQFEIADHWDADLCAIGIAAAGSPRQLAYISTFGKSSGRYYLELELPGESDDLAD